MASFLLRGANFLAIDSDVAAASASDSPRRLDSASFAVERESRTAELDFAGAGDVTGCRLDCEMATKVDSSAAMSAEADIVSKIIKIFVLASVVE